MIKPNGEAPGNNEINQDRAKRKSVHRAIPCVGLNDGRAGGLFSLLSGFEVKVRCSGAVSTMCLPCASLSNCAYPAGILTARADVAQEFQVALSRPWSKLGQQCLARGTERAAALGRGCLKTQAFNLRVESPSRFRQV